MHVFPPQIMQMLKEILAQGHGLSFTSRCRSLLCPLVTFTIFYEAKYLKDLLVRDNLSMASYFEIYSTTGNSDASYISAISFAIPAYSEHNDPIFPLFPFSIPCFFTSPIFLILVSGAPAFFSQVC